MIVKLLSIIRRHQLNYKKEISVSKIKREAEELYGQFYCSEAIVSVIRSNFELDVPEEIISMSSGFPVGIGGSMCLCGAVSGGLMTLGLFFGRTQPGDPKITKVMKLSNELHDWFKSSNGKNALCCRIITRGMEMGSAEHVDQCRFLTGLVAEQVAKMIARELELTIID